MQRQVPWIEVLSREVPLLWWSRECLWSSRSCSLSTVVDISTVSQRPSWCRRCSCGYGRRCVHAATVSSTVEVPQIPFIARVCGRLVVLRDGYATFSNCVMVVMKGFFDAFCVIFRALPDVPELSASFSSFRALTTVSARGLQWVCQFILRCCGHTHSLICH